MVYFTETEVPVVFAEAQSNGGVNEMLVELDFVQTVVVALPHVATMVCVKLLNFFDTVKVCAVPKVPAATDNVDFLGIVVSVVDFVPVHHPES